MKKHTILLALTAIVLLSSSFVANQTSSSNEAVTHSHSSKCHDTDVSEEVCYMCNGSGYQTCGHCGGDGKYVDDVCPVCSGTGKNKCSTCYGTGKY